MNGILIFTLILYCVLGIVSAQQQQQCPETNVAVIVVASVFGTLGVVLLVLGIIFFLLWKRRRDISKPPRTPTKKNHLTEDREIPSPDGGLSNPAFSDGEQDLSLIEEGIGGYVKCKEYISPEKKKSPAKTSIINDPTKKTWTSLPKPDLPPGPTINGSVGSFDDNFISMDPEVTSVWLQSQDFIGLGFNIAGSMRDGIYVSQVHNRGPAVESGKFKLGDRILSVTVSFENMVYEDALTILSYASPYPVKVTLQKEKIQKDRRISSTNSHLSHPLYRSQSVDTLLKLGKEPLFQPKRRFSEMRPETKTNFSKSTLNGNLQTTDEKDTLQTSFDGIVTPNFGQGQSIELSEVTVHNVDDNKNEKLSTDNGESVKNLVPNVTVNVVNEETPTTQEKEGDNKTQLSSTAVEFAELFDKLNEQDKLDMLRLSYEDPNSNMDNSQVIVPAETSFIESLPSAGNDSTLTNSDLDPKSIPIKPERRKKKSSSNSSVSSADESLSSPSTPRHMPPPDDVLEEDVIAPISTTSVESMPNAQQEIMEDFITPMKKDRKIDISTNKIEFSPVEKVEPEELADSPRDTSRTLVDYSLSDMESTLRPPTPETAPPIEEDMIMPIVVKKGEMSAPMPGIEILPDTALNKQDHSNSASSSDDETQITQIENTSAEIEQDWTEMALNLKSKMDLFSTPYPSRNTKESTSGMSYNISMDELNDIEAKLRSEIKGKNVETPKKGKGGIGFEVRDDVMSGEFKNVELDNKIIRPISYTDKLSEATEKSISKYRASSFKDDLRKAGKDANDNPLDWSGKRLVRSGSFSDIPQDDSVSDWTDPNVVNESNEHVKLQTSLSSDFSSDANSNFLAKKPLTKATLFKARDNLADLSDNSDSSGAVSNPSSQSSSPPPPYIANGEDNGISTSPETTPIKSPLNLSEIQTSTKIITDNVDSDMKINTDIIPTVTTKYEGSGAYTVTVNRQQEDDTDC